MKPYEREGGEFSQAAFRWVLSNPNVDALVISMNSPHQIDEYLGASGKRGGDVLEYSSPASLRSFAWVGGLNIQERPRACDSGDPELARRDYAQLGKAASPCLACDGSPCAGACPNGIPIARFTKDAALRLA